MLEMIKVCPVGRDIYIKGQLQTTKGRHSGPCVAARPFTFASAYNLGRTQTRHYSVERKGFVSACGHVGAAVSVLCAQ